MNHGIPGLTPEQFQQAGAYAREHVGGIRMAAVTLGFMSLDQLRTIRAQEQAAANTSAHAAQEPAGVSAVVPGLTAQAASGVAPSTVARATQASACAERAVQTYCKAFGLAAKPIAVGKARADAVPAVKAGGVPVDTDKLSAQRAVAESAVALFKQANQATVVNHV